MPNPAQIATYEYIRSEIARLRGPQSHVPLSLDQVTSLADDGEDAVFLVNGTRVFVKKSGKVVDTGLPDCPTYASGLLPRRLLPAIAADLLTRGNPHKPFLHSQSHTPESFLAYLQHGTPLGENKRNVRHDAPVAAPERSRPAIETAPPSESSTGEQSKSSERIYCNKCRRKTLHRLLKTTSDERIGEYGEDVWDPDSGDIPSCIFFDMLECCGCRDAVLRRTLHCLDPEVHRRMGGAGVVDADGNVADDVRYFPPAVVRDPPKWRFKLPLEIRELLEEVYKSIDAENLRLPMMGARTLVDMMILEKIGDVGGFKEKLKEWEKRGFVSSRDREALYVALEVGNAAAHRGHAPTKSEVHDVMDIVEAMLVAVYVFPEVAQGLKKTTPARPSRQPKAP